MTGNIDDIVNQFNLYREMERSEDNFDELMEIIDDDLLAIAGLIEKVRATTTDFDDGKFLEEVDEHLKDLL